MTRPPGSRALFELAWDEDVRMVTWFQYDKETDWRLDSSPAAADALRRAATAPGRVTNSWPVGPDGMRTR